MDEMRMTTEETIVTEPPVQTVPLTSVNFVSTESPVEPASYFTPQPKKASQSKSNSTMLIVLVAVISTVLIVGAVTAVLLLGGSGSDEQSTQEIQALIDKNQFTDALAMIEDIEDEDLKGDLIDALQKQQSSRVTELIDENQFTDALAMIEDIENEDLKDDLIDALYKQQSSCVTKLINAGDLTNAANILNEAQQNPEYQQLSDTISEKGVQLLIDDNKYADAIVKIETISDETIKNNLFEEVYKKHENRVTTLMDEGDYIEAKAVLDEVPRNPEYQKLDNTIVMETWIMTCALEYKPFLKNPRSMMINSVEVYEGVKGDEDQDKLYPVVIMNVSGQNSYGGYSSSYALFSSVDLECLGITSSLTDPDEDEIYVAAAILVVRDRDEITYPYDLNRINKLLENNVSVKMEPQEQENADAVKT